MIASENACNSSYGILSWIGVLGDCSTRIALPMKRILCACSTEMNEVGSILCLNVKMAFQFSSSLSFLFSNIESSEVTAFKLDS